MQTFGFTIPCCIAENKILQYKILSPLKTSNLGRNNATNISKGQKFCGSLTHIKIYCYSLHCFKSNHMSRYLNFEPDFELRWCRA